MGIYDNINLKYEQYAKYERRYDCNNDPPT